MVAWDGNFDAYWIDIPNNQLYKVDFQHHSEFIKNNSNLLANPKDAQRNPYKAAYDNGWVHLVYNLDTGESNVEGHEDKIKAAWRKAKSTLLKSKRVYVDIVKPGKREPTKQKDFGLPHQRDKMFMYFTGQADPSARMESLMESSGMNIELNAEKYGEYVEIHLHELQAGSQRRFSAGQSKNLYTIEEMEKDIDTLIKGTMENLKTMKAKLLSMYAKFNTKWQGTSIVITPHFNKGMDFSFQPCDDFTIKLGTHPYAPDFTLFDMGSTIEDVLDAGDKDFFIDAAVESDYFTLVQAFQDPSIFDMGEKIITLFTARPREERNIYDGATTVPANIFLTSDPDEAFGYATDMNNRDVYKVKVKQKYLVKTLDAGRKKNYQTVNSGEGNVPVEMTDRLTEGALPVNEDISWQTWWFHQIKGIITLKGNENEHWWYVVENAADMGLNITDLLKRHNGNLQDFYDDDDSWDEMKNRVFVAGWVRLGFVGGKSTYVVAQRRDAAKDAANWLFNETNGRMAILELEIKAVNINVRLRDDSLEKFLSKGLVDKNAEKLEENELSIASFRGYAGWFRNDVGFIPLSEHYHTLDVAMTPSKYGLTIEQIKEACPQIARVLQQTNNVVTDHPEIAESEELMDYMNSLGWTRIGYNKFSKAITIVSPTLRAMRQALLGFGEKFPTNEFTSVFYRIYDVNQEGCIQDDMVDLFLDKGRLPRQRMAASQEVSGNQLNEFLMSDFEKYQKEIGTIENAKKILGPIWNNKAMLIRAMNGNSPRPDDIRKAAAARMMHHYLMSHPEVLNPVKEADQYDMFNPNFHDLADKVWRFTYNNRIPKEEIKKVANGALWQILCDLKYRQLWDGRVELADAMRDNVRDHAMYRAIYNYLTSKGY